MLLVVVVEVVVGFVGVGGDTLLDGWVERAVFLMEEWMVVLCWLSRGEEEWNKVDVLILRFSSDGLIMPWFYIEKRRWFQMCFFFFFLHFQLI